MTPVPYEMIEDRMGKLIAAIAVLALVSGCSGLKQAVNPYEENFRCKAKDSEGKCVDTPAAYRESLQPESQDDTASAVRMETENSRYREIAELLDAPEAPLLKPPKVLRVLLLPYRGENNELFMSRWAYLEVEPSQWVLSEIHEKAP